MSIPVHFRAVFNYLDIDLAFSFSVASCFTLLRS